MNCLVIGGTGYIGRALVAELLKRGETVTVVHRHPKHDLGRRVANIQADRRSFQHFGLAHLIFLAGALVFEGF